MGFFQKKKEISEANWIKEIEEYWPEIRMPGYWDNLYENCVQWARGVTAGKYWNDAKEQLQLWKTEFRTLTRDALLMERDLPYFVSKGGKGIKNKLYRKRLKNEEYKNEVFDKEGPPIPNLNDLVRTRVPCRYLDGVDFLATKLHNLASSLNLDPKRNREGRLEGYYAQHIYFTANVFYRIGGQDIPATVRCEIQVATQLSTVIWEASHPIYERHRLSYEKPEEWQWNPKDLRFIARQLGHTVHLVDGLLVQVRDKK